MTDVGKEFEKTRRRGPGRPKGKTRRTVTTEEVTDDEEETAESPLAAFFAQESDHVIAKVRVMRTDPHEGVLALIEDQGTIDTLSEKMLSERWGGGTFRLQAMSSDNKIRAVRVVTLAGDPIFMSEAASVKWRRSQGLPASISGPPNPAAPNFEQMLLFLREQETARAEADQRRREAEREAERQTMERRVQLEREAEERRRKDDDERDRRRRTEEDERERRRRLDDEEREKRNQSYTTQMLSMVRESSNQALQIATQGKGDSGGLMEAVKVIAVIKDAFGGNAGGEEPLDPLALIAKHGGEWLRGIGNAVGSVIREAKGPEEIAALPSRPNPGNTVALPPRPTVPNPGVASMLPASLLPRVVELTSKIAAAGHDPEEVIGAILDNVNGSIEGQLKPKQGPTQQPQSAQASPKQEPAKSATKETLKAVAEPPPVSTWGIAEVALG